MVSVGVSWFLCIFTIHSYSYTTYSFPNVILAQILPANLSFLSLTLSALFLHKPVHLDTGCSLQAVIGVKGNHLYFSYMEVGLGLRMYICWQGSPNWYWNGKTKKKWGKNKHTVFITTFCQVQNFRSVLTPREGAQDGNVWVSTDPLRCEVYLKRSITWRWLVCTTSQTKKIHLVLNFNCLASLTVDMYFCLVTKCLSSF